MGHRNILVRIQRAADRKTGVRPNVLETAYIAEHIEAQAVRIRQLEKALDVHTVKSGVAAGALAIAS